MNQKQDTPEHIYTIFPVLRERRKPLARTLSGGEQQMVAFGRALMARPRFPRLGARLVLQISEVIQQINQAG